MKRLLWLKDFVILSLVCTHVTMASGLPPDVNIPRYITVKEDVPIGSIIGSLTAIDPEGVRHIDVITGSTSLVRIEESTTPGNWSIILNTTLDRETTALYILSFTADASGPFPLSLSMNMFVQDVNDVHPMFENLPYNIDLKEDTPSGQIVYTNISASDPDDGSGGIVNYYMQDVTQGPVFSSNASFEIDRYNGSIFFTGKLDFEIIRFYHYIVIAVDGGNLSSRADLYISVLEPLRNDTMGASSDASSDSSSDLPVVSAPHSISVREDVPLGSVILTIKATSPAGRPIPVVTESKSVIRIEESTHGNWNIILNTTLDREATSGISLSFTADPHGRIPLPFCIYMEVQDVNDVAPIFLNLPYNVYLREDTESNQVVYTNITATDPDEGVGGIVTFHMQDMTHHSSVNSNANFHMDPNTGNIFLTGTLDYETNRFYHYMVTVVDGGNLSSVADLFIAVIPLSFVATP